MSASLRLLPLLTLVLALGACSTRRFELPSDPGTAMPDFETVHRDLSAACRDVRSMTAAISLRGRAAGERLSGTLDAGFRAPGSMLLEFRAGPLGTLGFVLAANETAATLLLPRDKQVVRAARGEDILGALTGISLSPADLLAILSGCVVPSPRATGGRTHAGGQASIELDNRATLYLQRTGSRWHLRAARRGDWRVDYIDWPATSTFPARVQLTAAQPVAVDVRAGLSQVETNVTLEDKAFNVAVPNDFEAISVEDVRRAGPLRDSAP